GYLRRLVIAADDDGESLARAADGYARLGRFDDAFDLASRAKADDGTLHELAHGPLGLALAHRGDYAAALEHLSRAEPDAAVLTARIRARIARGDLTGAATDAAHARQVPDRTPELRTLAADVRGLARRLQEPGGTGEPLERFLCADYLQRRGELPARVDALL